MTNSSERPIRILLIEDNPADARLLQESLKEAKIYNTLYVAEDGIAAMDFLYRRGKFTDVPSPNVILLDLNLPKKDGREVLKEVKGDADLKHIPVVVVTSSKAEEDIAMSYDLHANCYVIKPLELEQFSKTIKSIEEFWFKIVKLPPASRA
jgi:two-component system response regulator